MMKSKKDKEHPRYCRCTVTCTSKIKRTTRLRHYRKANIPFNEAPPSITATESSNSDDDHIAITNTKCSQFQGDEQQNNGYLGSGSECGLDNGDPTEEDGDVGETVLETHRELEHEAFGMDVDEDFPDSGLEDTNSEPEDMNNEASEFDEWKEFDEEAETGLRDFLSDSDRLSELDEMMEDDLAADADEAEGWANRQSFLDLITEGLKNIFRKGIFNRSRSR
jgi:hypothetical protein